MAREEITGLQYLRAIAVSVVVFDHSVGFTGGYPAFDTAALAPWLQHGPSGVNLFFIVSGFIIAIVSLHGPDLRPAIGVREFAIRRFVRIVPLLWIAVPTFLALRWIGTGEFAGMAGLRAFFLLPGGPVEPAHIWSLRYEAAFYMVFAGIVLSPRRWRIFSGIVAAALLALVIATADDLWSSPWLRLTQEPPRAWPILAFGSGSALAILWLRHTRDWRFRLPVEPLWMLALAGFAITLIIVPGPYFGPLTRQIPFAALVFAAIHVECPPGLARRFGDLLGDASYAIYLFHYPAISVALAFWARLAPGTPPWLVVTGCIVLSTSAGVAVHLIVERPLIAALRRRFLHRARPAAPVSAAG